MCIIMYFPTGKTAKKETFATAFKNNPNGGGVMYYRGGHIMYNKGFMEFENGELTILEVDKNEEAKEYVENMLEKEKYEANSMSKEELITLLTGNYKKMEKELNKITSQSTKDFVVSIAKEIGLDSATKQSFIKEWLGSELSTEELFSKDEE